jgi:type IV pilus assembly protein PilW
MKEKKFSIMTVEKISKQYGFTLIELMVVMVITGIIVAAVFSAYTTQQKTYLAQEQIAEMQQNLRAAVDILSREIRAAGLDPTGDAGATITTALAGQISFTKDFTDNAGTGDSDGDCDDPEERIDFGFSAVAGFDADRDGLPDNPGNTLPLARQTYGPPPGFVPSGYQTLAENLQAIVDYHLKINYLSHKTLPKSALLGVE